MGINPYWVKFTVKVNNLRFLIDFDKRFNRGFTCDDLSLIPLIVVTLVSQDNKFTANNSMPEAEGKYCDRIQLTIKNSRRDWQRWSEFVMWNNWNFHEISLCTQGLFAGLAFSFGVPMRNNRCNACFARLPHRKKGKKTEIKELSICLALCTSWGTIENCGDFCVQIWKSGASMRGGFLQLIAEKSECVHEKETCRGKVSKQTEP